VALPGEALRRLLAFSRCAPFAPGLLSRHGTNGKNGDLFIDFTEVTDLNGEYHE